MTKNFAPSLHLFLQPPNATLHLEATNKISSDLEDLIFRQVSLVSIKVLNDFKPELRNGSLSTKFGTNLPDSKKKCEALKHPQRPDVLPVLLLVDANHGTCPKAVNIS